jgi:N-dimethylarginine dimethylaminohydrolase
MNAPQSHLTKKEADKAVLPSQLDFPALLMNFPFTVDNRADNNALMKKGAAPYNRAKAFSQFMELYASLAKDALVYLLPSGGDYQDLPFVANLGLCPPHEPETMLLANFTSPPRKGEAKVGRAFFEQMGFHILQPPYHWEGEADLKFIRKNLYIGGYGQRTEREALDWMADKVSADIVEVRLNDPKLYHFDCSFFPLDSDKALVAVAALDPGDVAKIEKVVNIVEVPREYVYDGWTNSVRLGSRLLHADSGERSNAAMRDLVGRHGFELECVNLSEFGKSGADLSCMVLAFNVRNRDMKVDAQPTGWRKVIYDRS